MEEIFLGLPPFVNGSFISNCDFKSAKILYGIAAPIVVLITLIENIVYIVLINYVKEDRNAATVQGTGIAISNALHGVFQLPVLFHFFAENFKEEMTTLNWCYAYRVLGYVLPAICHTISMWQLLLYGVQRFVSFRWPFRALVWYKTKGFFRYTLSIYMCAFLVHIYKFSDFTYEFGTPCAFKYRPVFTDVAYQKFYRYLYTFSVQLIPCTIMTICVLLLIYAIRRTYLRRQNMFAASRTGVSRNIRATLQESQAIGILVLTLLIEWPITIFSLLIPSYDGAQNGCVYEQLIICHFVLLLIYALYFPVYFVLNFELRNTAKVVLNDVAAFFLRRIHERVATDDF